MMLLKAKVNFRLNIGSCLRNRKIWNKYHQWEVQVVILKNLKVVLVVEEVVELLYQLELEVKLNPQVLKIFSQLLNQSLLLKQTTNQLLSLLLKQTASLLLSLLPSQSLKLKSKNSQLKDQKQEVNLLLHRFLVQQHRKRKIKIQSRSRSRRQVMWFRAD